MRRRPELIFMFYDGLFTFLFAKGGADLHPDDAGYSLNYINMPVFKKVFLTVPLLVLLAFGLSACQKISQFHTHELQQEFSYGFDGSVGSAILADLRADGRPLLISTRDQDLGSSILLQNLHGKAFSQINLSEGKISGLKTITDPTNNSPWLFFSYNDGKKLYFTGVRYIWEVPLKREMRHF